MARRKANTPLNVHINGRLVGQLTREPSGAAGFQYGHDWIDWSNQFPVSLSLPIRPEPYTGAVVQAVFDNLLPDNADIRQRVAERTGATGMDPFSLLTQIGRDCVGAMQFIPQGIEEPLEPAITARPLSDEEIERILNGLARAPLGIAPQDGFRISIAGAQEKTALLFHEDRWKRPSGTTPTTHILKPQLGRIPTADGIIDLSNSVENEHYCLKVLEGFGLKVARTQIVDFGQKRVLVVERFDRQWSDDGRLIRLPQEDFCQALSIPAAQKYQSEGGPSAADILKQINAADRPQRDQLAFFKSQIIFWLIGAADGHGKNFSLFLRPGGRFELTPFYDVLSVQPVVDAGRIRHRNFRLAMSVGAGRNYRILNVEGRHFVETGKEAGLGQALIRQALDEVRRDAVKALERARAAMPADFHDDIHQSVSRAVAHRLPRLDSAEAAL